LKKLGACDYSEKKNEREVFMNNQKKKEKKTDFLGMANGKLTRIIRRKKTNQKKNQRATVGRRENFQNNVTVQAL
jgi:hypothetical protein